MCFLISPHFLSQSFIDLLAVNLTKTMCRLSVLKCVLLFAITGFIYLALDVSRYYFSFICPVLTVKKNLSSGC